LTSCRLPFPLSCASPVVTIRNLKKKRGFGVHCILKMKLDVEGKFFTERVVRNLHRVSREVENVASLEVFKARFDGA